MTPFFHSGGDFFIPGAYVFSLAPPFFPAAAPARFRSFATVSARDAQPTRQGPLSWGRPRAGFSLTVFPRASRERGKLFRNVGENERK